MERSTFWALIDDTRAVSDGNPRRHASALRGRLERCDPHDIVGFERHWRKHHAEAFRWDLWAAAYLLNAGCDAECFEHFRSYVIALGERVFRDALADADSLVCLAGPPGPQFAYEAEPFGRAAAEAYEAVTGELLPDVGPALPDEPAGEEWDEERPELVVPRIAAAVGWIET